MEKSVLEDKIVDEWMKKFESKYDKNMFIRNKLKESLYDLTTEQLKSLLNVYKGKVNCASVRGLGC